MTFIKYIAAGQGALTLCCLFYSAWWYVAYNPKPIENILSSKAGLLFWITFICGLVGVYLNIYGIRNLADVKPICLFGGIAYIVLLATTFLIFNRPVTAELFLIVAWATLETSAIFAAYGNFSTIPMLTVAAATIFAMVAYLLYYNVDDLKAFYLGLLPLTVDAAGSAIILFSLISKFAEK